VQAAPNAQAFRLQPGEALGCVTRDILMCTMTVLGAPNEVYLLTHSALRARLGLPTSAHVSRIDPHSLKTLQCSPKLPGGPMWPGGLALHRNGHLYVVYGRYAHRLNRACEVTGSLKLPVNQAYNSFVVLACGLIVTKNLSDTAPAQLSVIDPDNFTFVGDPVMCPEPSIARLSAHGDTVYVVGTRSIFRMSWDAASRRLVPDPLWRFDYLAGSQGQTYGWDVVLADGQAWFMDNGKHRYRINMIGAGVSTAPNRLIRVALDDSNDHSITTVSGVAGGSITNPPLVDAQRHIVLAYDSANRVLCAYRFDPPSRALEPLWRKSPFGCSSHMILYPQSGEVVTNDYRRGGEEVVVLDIETGTERARVRVGGLFQGVVFPSPGWHRDLYWCSLGRLSRVFVTNGLR
jgi:hypothetical protein